VQALLKASPVAGSDEVGRGFADMVKKIMVERKDPAEIISSIKKMRDKHARTAIESGMVDPDIKEGLGGIRDIEFLAQGLQLVNCSSIPELISGNTLEALALLGRHNLLPAATVEQLKSDYEFLRRVEHCMQIFEDRQIHILPESDTEREALARRVLGVKAGADDFLKDIAACQARTRNSFKTCLDG
jgi:glutamate-ammonia-ligase adenylyltransferase